ncbi:MAG: hypothetical protein IJW55_09430 [Clostridia bacterium]|nr:hypothetical protein [Clostridia bacterium]
MYTIIGIEKREGIYEGTAYNNTILHTTYTKKDAENVCGLCVSALKIKTAICPIVNLGDSVDPLYDKYGNIAHLSVTPAKK